jgi:choline dehydrogenase-like flavoprotein
VLIEAGTSPAWSSIETGVVVVGAGPAGIVVSLELARAGYDVVLLESGATTYSPAAQELAEAAEWDPARHAPMSLATRRQVGGASAIWGGRCVPYDPVDFAAKDFGPPARWPLGYEDIQPFYQRACDWSVCGRAVFDANLIPTMASGIVPGFPNGEVRTSALERWSLPTDFGKEYRRELLRRANVRLITGLTCTNVVCRPGAREVDHLNCRSLSGADLEVRARYYVIACGGLDSTRLLLASEGPSGGAPGNHSGHLGRWYMSHAEGVIANVVLSTPAEKTSYGYDRDVDGVYVRRRFTFSAETHEKHSLPNIAAWLANPDLADARHGRGDLSLAYLALRSPLGQRVAPDAQRLSLTGDYVPGAPYGAADQSPTGAHLRNMARDPGSTLGFALGFGSRRFLARRRKVPGFFSYSESNSYPLQYHAEQLPNYDSRVELTRTRDSLGMPRLKVDLRFSDADVDGVLRAHTLLDSYLRRNELGCLLYHREDLDGHVRERLGGGFHQLGTTRMSERPEDGVVDRDLAVHGVENLFVASSSSFVTSGQANSTFMIVAFAVRLADHLRSLYRQDR